MLPVYRKPDTPATHQTGVAYETSHTRCFLAAGIVAPLASAHFKLSEPASWINENNLGDPQKLGPCGGTSADAGTVTNAVTKVQGGQKLHLKWTETVYHPGHYRIALSVNSRDELPA